MSRRFPEPARPHVFVALWAIGAGVLWLAIDVGDAVSQRDGGPGWRGVVLAAAAAAVGVGCATAAAHLLGAVLRRDIQPWLVGLSVWASVLAAIDLYALRQANQGLMTIWGLWMAEGGAGLSAALEASGVGVGVVAAALAAPVAVGALAARMATWPVRAAVAQTPTTPANPRARLLVPLTVAAVGAATVAGLDPHAELPRLLGRLLGPSRRWLAALPPDGEPLSLVLRPPLPSLASDDAAGTPPALRPEAALAADAPELLIVAIVESLRADAVEAETMPHLARLAARGEVFRRVVAAANATHPGWYTLLYGRWPHLWHRLRSGTLAADGAAPLRLLHEAGYALAAYAGAGLDYYGFADRAFGRGGPRPIPIEALVDARDAFAAGLPTRPEADRFAIDAAIASLRRPRAPRRRVLLVWLDGSHFPYAWPGSASVGDAVPRGRFGPVSDEGALRMGRLGQAGQAGLRNRYRNALAAVDAELGRLFAAADAVAPGKVAFVVTGDHGEELYEHGKFAHDSELCDVQLRVPLIVSWPGRGPAVDDTLASHVDVMPTILGRLGLGARAAALLDGQSLDRDGALGGAARDWVEIVATSAGSPSVAAIVRDRPGATGSDPLGPRLEVAFSDREDVLASRALHLLRIADADGRGVVRRFDGGARDIAASSRASLLPFAGALRTLYGAALVGEVARGAVDAPGADRAAWAVVGEALDLPEAATAARLEVEVRNVGSRPWLHDVRVGWHWLDAAGVVLAVPERRALLPRDVAPGLASRLTLALHPPPAAAALRLDMVREHVAWFRDRGSEVLVVPLRRR